MAVSDHQFMGVSCSAMKRYFNFIGVSLTKPVKNILTSITYLITFGFQAITISAVSSNDKPWGALRMGNHVVLIRRALAPDFSVPDNFDVKIVQHSATRTMKVGTRREQSENCSVLKVPMPRWCIPVGGVDVLKRQDF